MSILSLENVTKQFGHLVAVDDLSVEIPAGCIYGFLGPNGAGKTTTIRMMMNIIYPDSGRISIFGQEYTGEMRERIGYLPEERGLYRKMRVKDILHYFGQLKGMAKKRLRTSVDDWLQKMELTGWANSKVEELSRGMQQKIQFIATVIHDPDLIILDEPFAGLDPVNADLLKTIIIELRSAGKTVVFSTHVMEQAEKLCDAIFLINKGRKILDGGLDEIKDRYRSNSVIVEYKGDGAFIAKLDQVKSVTGSDSRIEIALNDGARSRDLLKALVDRVDIERFEVKRSSLDEIFIELVKGEK